MLFWGAGVSCCGNLVAHYGRACARALSAVPRPIAPLSFCAPAPCPHLPPAYLLHQIVAKADKKKLKPSTQRTVPLNLRKGPHLLNGALPLGAPRLLSESSGSTSETSGSSGSSSEERWSRHHWEPRGAVEIAPRPVPRPLPPVQQVLPQFMAIDPMPMPMYMPRERMAMPGLRREPAPALMGTASAPAGPAGPAGRPGPPGRPAWAPAPLVDDDSDDDGSDSDDDSDDEDDHHGPGHHGHGHEDTSFPGALGFGAQGDLCMYQQLEQLSPPCVSAVADVYALRQSYWAEAEGHGHHHCGGGLVLIGLLLLFLGARFISRKRRQAVQGLLVGLEADPALKAKVEESLGIQVPAPCKCPSAGQSCCKRLCTTLAVLLGTLLGSLLISISSLEVTSSIVASMDAQVDPQSGEPMPTSPGVVLAILFAVCTVHVLAVAGLVRLCKAGYQKMTRSAGASAGTGAGAVAPSAPTHVHPVADPVYSPSPAASWDLGTWFNNLRARQGIYAPLMAEDTEMVAVSSNAAPSVQVYAGVPIRANQITFTAVPVNSGNFV